MQLKINSFGTLFESLKKITFNTQIIDINKNEIK